MTQTDLQSQTAAQTSYDVPALVNGLYTDGIVGLKGAFSREFIAELREDIDRLFAEALARPNGAVGRGPNRYYVEIHPEDIRGFVELATHPWVHTVAESVLGPDYVISEIGFDVPLQGAKNQPWHRDFRSPEETYVERRLTSLAFNVTTVDVTEDMGPFEIAQGTQFDDGREFDHEMFPSEDLWPSYAARGVRKFPQMGDISARSALTLHRGTKHDSPKPRPVLVLGLLAPGADASRNDLTATHAWHDSLPAELQRHLGARLVDELTPLQQKHTIEGLVMGAP
jgi:hypothetical protein